MINTILCEASILLSFLFALIICYYDKVELFINTDKRNLLGYLILFSIISNNLFFYIK